jgi:hypothetical protein
MHIYTYTVNDPSYRIYTYLYIYMYRYIYIYTYICIYTYVYIHVCVIIIIIMITTIIMKMSHSASIPFFTVQELASSSLDLDSKDPPRSNFNNSIPTLSDLIEMAKPYTSTTTSPSKEAYVLSKSSVRTPSSASSGRIQTG